LILTRNLVATTHGDDRAPTTTTLPPRARGRAAHARALDWPHYSSI
jgi:hypothetical protein